MIAIRVRKKYLLAALLVIASCNRDVVEEKTAPLAPPPVAVKEAAPPAVNGPKLQPVDEAGRDPSFLAYRTQLFDAVRRRDVEAIVKEIDPNIRTSFGDGGGAAELRKTLERPEIWGELEQILTHGGTFQEGSFWAPYVYSAWPEKYDAFTWVAVVAKDVPLRESPNGRTIATLAYDLVERVDETHVKTADGRTGYVDPKFLRSPIGYRAGFNKTKDRWRMTALVAGD